MAGKTKKRGRPVTPKTPTPAGMMDGPLKGHLGIKSGPLAPTDAKLTSQYMVMDHMNAHYRKISKAKSAVDCSAPKAWLVSQKVRDQARREALKKEIKRRNDWLKGDQRNYSESYESSEADRQEMFAMLQSYQGLPEAGPDELDGRHAASNNTMEAHASNSSAYRPDARDLQLISQMVDDAHMSPSKYHSSAHVRSNIPATTTSTHRKKPSNAHHRATIEHHHHQERDYYDGYANDYYAPMSARGMKPLTPRSGDLLEQHGDKFNKPDKPFAPRTLKYNNTQSRISSLKCYNPPKKAATPREETQGEGESQEAEKKKQQHRGTDQRRDTRTHGTHGSQGAETRSTPPPKPAPRGGDRRGSADLRSTRGSLRGYASRPETPYSEVDWMNETWLSRDGSQVATTPAGVPALDISLDADHVKWLKEQTRKAHVRSSARSARSRSEAGEDLGSTWGSQRGAGGRQTLHTTTGTDTQHLNGSATFGTATYGTGHHDSSARPQFTLSGTLNKSTGYMSKTATSARLDKEEEELKYLEFIQDVTNDVLDRNIYTNRVLKSVFESHVEKRKHELKISKMREMLEDLRLDLGIPDSEDDDGLGLKSTLAGGATLDFSVDGGTEPSHARRRTRKHAAATAAAPNKLPNLRHGTGMGYGTGPKRSASPDAKPPLPGRPGSRGSNRGSTGLQSSSEFRASLEEPVPEDLGGTGGTETGTGSGTSTFGMVTALQTAERTAPGGGGNGTADILTISYGDDDKGVDEVDGNGNTLDGNTMNLDGTMDGNTLNGTNTEDVTHEPANEDTIVNEKNEEGDEKAEEYDDDYELPAKTKMVDDMTLSYQYALEDTLDNDGVASDDDDDEDEVSRAMAEASKMQTLAPIMEVDTPKSPKERSPRLSRPTPKRRTSLTPRTDPLKDTPRSQARTNTTSESIDISELDEDEDDF